MQGGLFHAHALFIPWEGKRGWEWVNDPSWLVSGLRKNPQSAGSTQASRL